MSIKEWDFIASKKYRIYKIKEKNIIKNQKSISGNT
jgi:hypothetical protein